MTNGCKAISLKEYWQIQHEAGKFIYPQDFPSTVAYNERMQQKQVETIESYFRKPLGKRTNYQKIISPYAFGANWNHFGTNFINTITQVKISMLGRGNPKDNALICLPKSVDLEKIEERIKRDETIGCIWTEPINTKANETLLKENIVEELTKAMPSRKIIGFLTSGFYSYRQSKGAGVGYISNLKDQLLSEQEILVLIRNPSSRNYFFAKCAISI